MFNCRILDKFITLYSQQVQNTNEKEKEKKQTETE